MQVHSFRTNNLTFRVNRVSSEWKAQRLLALSQPASQFKICWKCVLIRLGCERVRSSLDGAMSSVRESVPGAWKGCRNVKDWGCQKRDAAPTQAAGILTRNKSSKTASLVLSSEIKRLAPNRCFRLSSSFQAFASWWGSQVTCCKGDSVMHKPNFYRISGMIRQMISS